MKKFFSSILVVALLASSFATNAFAEVTKETPAKLIGTLTQIVPDENGSFGDYQDAYDDNFGEGFDLYSIKISVANSPLDAKFASRKYTGRALTGMTVGFLTDTEADYDVDYFFASMNVGILPDANQVVFSENSAGAPLSSVTGKSFTAGETAEVAELLVFVAPGTEINFEWKETQSIGTQYYDGAVKPSANMGAEYNNENGLLVVDDSCKDGFVIGGEEKPTTNTFYYEADLAAADTAKGFCFVIDNLEDSVDAKTSETFDFKTDVVAAESVTVGLELYNIPAEISADAISVIAKLVF